MARLHDRHPARRSSEVVEATSKWAARQWQVDGVARHETGGRRSGPQQRARSLRGRRLLGGSFPLTHPPPMIGGGG